MLQVGAEAEAVAAARQATNHAGMWRMLGPNENVMPQPRGVAEDSQRGLPGEWAGYSRKMKQQRSFSSKGTTGSALYRGKNPASH